MVAQMLAHLGPNTRIAAYVRIAVIGALAGWLALAPAASIAQNGRLEAAVDRETIRVNESFRYVLRAEGAISGRPDLSALAQDFDVIDDWQSTTIQMVNGRTAQVAEWGVELMPRQPGRFELPAVSLGGVMSNAVEVEILPESAQNGDAGDIFIEVELDRPVAYVQSQVLYTLRLFVGIGTGRATLTAPLVEGGEAIVEKLGSDREYQAVRGDRAYNVRERSYAIFPQTPGELTLGPAVFDAMVITNRGFTRQQRVRSDVLALEVRPAVSPPASHPAAVWLPAADLRIEQRWSDGGEIFEQGVPRTRILTIVAEGLLETQLPELDPDAADGFRQYADQPELERDIAAGGIEARRTERFAVIAQRPGPVTLPGLEVPWWDVDEERWQIARVEPVTVEVLPGEALDPVPDAAASSAPRTIVERDAGFWPWLSGGLAAGWLATLAAFGWFAARSRRRDVPAAAVEGPRPSVRSLMRQLDAACRVDDAQRVRALLLDWARLQFSDAPPASLGALAARIPGPLAAEIATLEAALYGPRPGEWRGRRLAELLRETRSVARNGSGPDDKDPLVPLYR